MTDSSLIHQQQFAQTVYGSTSASNHTRKVVERLFQQKNNQARWHQLWSTLRRRSSRSWSLHPEEPIRKIQKQQKTVSVSQIKGSTKGRSFDFDDQFRPLQSHNKDRWVRVAIADRTGIPLPPVDLLQVDDVYFVTDGHHRVSVAKAFERDEIRANVTVGEYLPPRN